MAINRNDRTTSGGRRRRASRQTTSNSRLRASGWQRDSAIRTPQPAPRKVLLIFGTRPEAIKMAPIIQRLQKSSTLEVSICVTAQHRELLDQMLEVFGIHADFDLGVMSPNQGLSECLATILSKLAPVLATQRPAAVLVQGDTTSSLAGALAAYHARIPVGHVEAGLRTGNPYEPFPEEMNRQMVSRLATWHFAPTVRARANLVAEGIGADRVLVTGNTIVDALHYISRVTDRRSPVEPAATDQRMLLVTAHRRENFGGGIDQICSALLALAQRNPDLRIIYPVHPNPSVDRPVRQRLADHARIDLIAPLDYLDFVALMRRADVILSDSGGIQEEAPSLGVPVLVTRTITERPEGVDAGVARLVGTDESAIITQVEQLLRDDTMRARLRRTESPYGDGRAAQRIVEHLEHALDPSVAANDLAVASGGARA